MTTERETEMRRFIGNEIYLCQSSLIEELFKKEIFSLDDIENLYRPFDGKLLSPSMCASCMEVVEKLDSETGDCLDCFEGNQEAQEVYEWWAVSKWFANKLKERGEPVIDNSYGIWWGRTTTGQSLCMDFIIHTMYDEVTNA